MKKSIAVLLALVLMMTVFFFGCGKKEEAEEVNGDATSQQAPAEGSSENSGTADNGGASTDTTDVTNATGTTEATGNTEEGTTDVTGTTDATKPSKPDFSTSEPNSNNNTQQNVVPQSTSKIEKYRQIFSSGCYSMTVTTVKEGAEDMAVEFACKNGNLRMGMDMEGSPATMIYTAANDTSYILIDFMGKFYTELTEELMGEEIDLSEATKNFEIAADAVITEGTDTLDGKTYATETITSGSKTTVFFFENDGTLIATKATNEKGEVSVTKLSNISTNVDDSLFEIPKGYVYMDFSWLMNMA